MPAFPYWIDDDLFDKRQHHLLMTAGPDPLLIMGVCSCGEYLYTGDDNAVLEAFDEHAKDVQLAVRQEDGSGADDAVE